MNEPFAVIREYSDLRKALAGRRRDLGLSQLATDEIAGVQSGYTAKLEVGIKNFGEMSLSSVLGALGLVLVAIEHPETDVETWTKARQREK
jgi:predicted transcriptional regulator